MGKSGIPYFPLDVELDEKMELIEAEYGLTGYAVILKLLQRIYGGHGYYIHWTYEVALLFAKRIGVGGSVVSEIIEAAVKRGVFHKKIFEKYKVLTSEGIQKRYFTAIARRKEIEVNDDILLVQVNHFCKNASILHKNASKNARNADIPAQRKEKERKEEKSREYMSRAGKPAQNRSLASIPPKREDVEQYITDQRYPFSVDEFMDYYQSNGWRVGKQKMKDWKAAVRNWARREKEYTKQKTNQALNYAQRTPAEASCLDNLVQY